MKVVIGVDSGGSKTRAQAVSLDGTPVGYGESGGGNPGHDALYCENIRSAIVQAAQPAGVENVVRIVAGIAGFDRPSDREWAESCTSAPGISAAQVQVNDTEIAHYGAFGGNPGIVSIQGAGSLIYARTDLGRTVRNFDFKHYARSAGPWIGSFAVHVLLARRPGPGDERFAQNVLEFWGVDNLDSLHDITSRHSDLPDRELRRRQGAMAPIVTQAAEEGSPIAIHVCRESAGYVTDGIRLLGRLFECDDVGVSLIGSCIRSPYMRQTVESALSAALEKNYQVIDPAFTPVVGAVLMALDQEGIHLPPTKMTELQWLPRKL